ncbi:MAG: GPW/gp25 family protein [Faecalibacterium sp.]
MDNRDFLGRGLSFPLRLDPRTGRFAVSSHEQSIRESVGIILGTYRGERVMRPEFGANTADYAFAPSDSSLQESIAYDLQRQLVLQEPRIRDIEVTCEEPSCQTGTLVVHVAYTVRSTNNRFNQVYPFYTQGRQPEEEE